MSRPLRLLIVGSSDQDVRILLHALEQAGFLPLVERPANLHALRHTLQENWWDVIIADAESAQLGAEQALRLATEFGLDTPLLAISQQGDSGKAEYLMRLGARDFFVANQLTRMGQVIERELREIAFRQKLRECMGLLNRTSDACVVTDLECQITYWNHSAAELYGWNAEEVAGRNFIQLLHHEGDGRPHEASQEAFRTGEWSGELNQLTKHGLRVLTISRWTLLRDARQKPRNILVVNSDITRQKQLEAQFLRSQRMESLGTLASGIAHDLNNVLAPILMSIQFLRDTVADDASRTMLATLETSAQRGADIIKQVLTFARGMEGDRIALQPKYLLKEMAKIIQETFPKTITVKTEYTNDLWSVMGDATQLHQVLMNLCVNARDAMTGGGQLTLTAENVTLDESFANMIHDAKPGPYLVLCVADTGPGIAPVILDKIFDPFFTTKALGKGTGLGLATALGIVKSHGGFLQVKSEVGRGAQFRVYLPATFSQGTSYAPSEVTTVPRGSGQLILVVEDELSVREVTRRTLENNGYRVITAGDGTEALALFVQNAREVNAVLTDMVMPFMDGAATIRALRKINAKVPIIAASGMMSHRQEAEATGANVQAFLSKPFTAEQLLKCLNQAFNEPEPTGA
jgi:two-component system, cell cycle sensor histidine kinase and response regulator CckA